MVIGIIGESCTGKSTLAQMLAQRMRGDLPAPVAAMLEKKHGFQRTDTMAGNGRYFLRYPVDLIYYYRDR